MMTLDNVADVMIQQFATGLVHTMTRHWPIFLTMLFVGLVPKFFKFLERLEYERAGLKEIDKMSGAAFEVRLAKLFRDLGYEVTHTPQAGGDRGADLIIERNGERIAVQAKRWKRKVGNRSVQEVYASQAFYKCEKGIVVTNSWFTRAAKEQARACNVILWDRGILASKLKAATEINKRHPSRSQRA